MILTRQSVEMGPEGYIEIDMDGDDRLIDETDISCRQYKPLTAAPAEGAAVL